MRSKIKQRFVTVMLSISLLAGGYTPLAWGGLIGSHDLALDSTQSDAAVRVLRESIAQKLTQLGVGQDLVQHRVEALSYAELQHLDSKLDDIPAGAGALEVIGIVFLVLLILELLGVTNIFKKP